MRYVRHCLDVLTERTECTLDWEAMSGTECARVCPMCEKQVFDVAAMSELDADDFLQEHMADAPRLALHRRPDGRVMVDECPPGARKRVTKRVLAGTAALVLVVMAVALR